MKKITITISIICLLLLLLMLLPSAVLSQSEEDGESFFREAKSLHDKARTSGQLKHAVGKYKEALEIARRVGDKMTEAKILRNLGVIFKHRGQNAKALECFGKSLAVFRALKDPSGEAQTIGDLGTVYSTKGNYDEAAKLYEESLTINQKIRNRTGEARDLNNLGLVHFHLTEFDKSIRFYEQSLAIFQQIKDRLNEGRTLGKIGMVYKHWGKYDKALRRYKNSLSISKEIGDRIGEAFAYANLGAVYSCWGQYDRSLQYYEKSLAICREFGIPFGEGSALIHMGEIYARSGKTDKSLHSFQKALEIYKRIKRRTQEPKNRIANLYMDVGDLTKAEPFALRAGYYSTRGRFHLMKRDYDKARQCYEAMLTSAKKNRDADDLFLSCTGLGLVCERTGNDSGAEKYYRKAVHYTEDLRSGLLPEQRKQFFDVRIGGFYRTAPYEGLARVLMRMRKSKAALETSEYTKARIFAESMSRAAKGSQFDLPEEVLKQNRKITDQLAAITRRLKKAYKRADKPAVQKLEPKLIRMKRDFRVHINMLREKYPLFSATKYPEPMDLSQAALKPDEWVLSYDVTDTGVLIYLTKGTEIVRALFRPIPKTKIDDLIAAYRKPLSGIATSRDPIAEMKKFDFVSGKRLSDILLAYVLSHLPKGSPVIVIPDDSLGFLSFETLVLNDKGKISTETDLPSVVGAEFFGDRNPISYYQSITALTLARIHGRKKTPGEKSLVMADPVFDADDKRLSSGSKEIKFMSAQVKEKLNSIRTETGLAWTRLPETSQLGDFLKELSPDKTELYTGKEASKPVLFAKNPLDEYGSIVFATHGFFSKDLPGFQEPVLVLTLVDQPKGQDGFLRLSEVMGLSLNADIVSLTACQTGIGKRILGEGTMGMGRAFQYAGAKSVLMSLWSVEQGASVKLMESFFKRLHEGKTKLEALQLARHEIRKAGYDHPVFWAGFILVGEVD